MDRLISISGKIINTRKRWMFLNLLLSLFLLLNIELFRLDRWDWLYLLYAIWQFVVYGILLRSELKSPGLSMLSLYFMGALMTVALPSYTYAVGLLSGKKFYCLDTYEITNFVFRTSVAMNIYYSLFILFLTRFTNERLFLVDINQVAKKYNLFYLALFLYLISFIFRAIPILGMISSSLEQLASALPLLVIFLLAVYCGLAPVRDKYYWLFVIILVLEVVNAFLFGMYKGGIILNAIMYILYYYLHTRTMGKHLINTTTVSIGVLFMFFILYIVYPFIILKRNESGFGTNMDESQLKEVDNMDILWRVITFDYEYDELGTGDDDSGSAFTGRMSAVYSNAFFYEDAYRNSYHRDMLEMSLQKMVPRIINPNKPEGSEGSMTYSYMRGKEFNPMDTSANYIGIFAGAYFWGGWPAALLMCFINAWVFALLLKVCFANLDNLFAWLIITMILMPIMRCFEESCDGGVKNDIFFLIYVLIIKVVSVIMKWKKRIIFSNSFNSIIDDNNKDTF